MPMEILHLRTHDEALHVWRERRAHGETLVHVDAHSDFLPSKQIDIGTFVYHAYRSGMIRSLYWVVPSLSFRYRWIVKTILRSLQRAGARLEWLDEDSVLRGTFEDLRIWIGPLQQLPRLRTRVLLDVDIDYFTMPIAEREVLGGLVIWDEPFSLVRRLRRSLLSWDVATVCASVHGGYVPLQWKCLARAVSDSLQEHGRAPAVPRLNQGALHYLLGDPVAARDLFERMTRDEPADAFRAAAHLWLVRIYTECDAPAEARRHLQAAIAIDRSYDTLWLCPAFGWWYQRRAEDVAACCAKWKPVLSHTPELLALWAMAIHRRAPERARSLAEAALDLRDDCLEAHLCLGRVCSRERDFETAVLHLEETLRLLRTGAGDWVVPPRASSQTEIHPSVVVPIMKELALAYAQTGSFGRAERYWCYLREKRLLSPCDIHRALTLSPKLAKSIGGTRLRRGTLAAVGCMSTRLQQHARRCQARLATAWLRSELTDRAQRRARELEDTLQMSGGRE